VLLVVVAETVEEIEGVVVSSAALITTVAVGSWLTTVTASVLLPSLFAPSLSSLSSQFCMLEEGFDASVPPKIVVV